MVRPLAVLCALVAACGCGRAPEAVEPPRQRPALAAADPAPAWGSFMKMTDANAGDYIEGDVLPADPTTTWRWTGRRPKLRFRLPDGGAWVFVADGAVAGPTLEKTGPVTISFFINGRLAERLRYTEAGQVNVEKAVDPSWLQAGENRVEIETDPVYVAADDGTALGMILSAAGFVR